MLEIKRDVLVSICLPAVDRALEYYQELVFVSMTLDDHRMFFLYTVIN